MTLYVEEVGSYLYVEEVGSFVRRRQVGSFVRRGARCFVRRGATVGLANRGEAHPPSVARVHRGR